MVVFLVLFGGLFVIGVVASIIGDWISDGFGGGCGSYSRDDSDNYCGDSYSSSDNEERFENRFPYEYDKETGYSRSDYCNSGNWTDSIGNQYEQKTDCWGSVYYEKIDDETDDE